TGSKEEGRGAKSGFDKETAKNYWFSKSVCDWWESTTCKCRHPHNGESCSVIDVDFLHATYWSGESIAIRGGVSLEAKEGESKGLCSDSHKSGKSKHRIKSGICTKGSI